MTTCPCRDCTRRYLTCHAECDDYKRFQTLRRQELDRKSEERRIDNTIYTNKKKRSQMKGTKMQIKLRGENVEY